MSQIRCYANGRDIQIWDLSACPPVILEPAHLSPLKAKEGFTVIDYLREQQIAPQDLKPLSIEINQYYHRIARPTTTQIPTLFTYPAEYNLKRYLAEATNQFQALLAELKTICRTVHPEGDNLKTYGHEIRNLLIVACTEVEMHFKGIYTANNGPDDQPNIYSYYQLNEHLRLQGYTIKFRDFPWLIPATPFSDWSSTTQSSLSWYSAYNKVKHDRENKFESASLQNAFLAMAAIAALIHTQGRGQPLQTDIEFVHVPNWAPHERYYRIENADMQSINCAIKARDYGPPKSPCRPRHSNTLTGQKKTNS